jgi:hypothetical protein
MTRAGRRAPHSSSSPSTMSVSAYGKTSTLAHLNDAVLGAFSRVNPSPTLDHLLRYLSTWSGSE